MRFMESPGFTICFSIDQRIDELVPQTSQNCKVRGFPVGLASIETPKRRCPERTAVARGAGLRGANGAGTQARLTMLLRVRQIESVLLRLQWNVAHSAHGYT